MHIARGALQVREPRAVVRRGHRDEIPDTLDPAEPLDVIARDESAHAETDEIKLAVGNVVRNEFGELGREVFEFCSTSGGSECGSENDTSI